ncbi:MAG: hypothetical protein LM590_06035 [Thermofilum sp.]|nr:hypothetical protein [Thermofilum sp.]
MLRQYLFNNGFIGHNWDWHYPTLSIYYEFAASRELQAWDYDDLGFPRLYGYSLPWFIFSNVARFGEPRYVQKLLLLAVPVVSGFNAFLLLIYLSKFNNYYNHNLLYFFICSIIYGFGPSTFYFLLAGSLTVLLANSLFPLAIYAMIYFYEEPLSIKSVLFIYFTITLISSSSISATILVYMMSLLYFIIVLRKNFSKIILSFIPSFAFYLGYFFPIIFEQNFLGKVSVFATLYNIPSPFLSFWQMDIYRRGTFILSVPYNFQIFFIILIISALLFLFSIFLNSKRFNSLLIWAFFSYLIFLGLSCPLFIGIVFDYLYKIPVFLFLRSFEYYSIPVSLSLSILTTFAIYNFISRQSLRLRSVTLLFVCILIISTLLPWASGDLGLTYRKSMYDSTLDIFQPSEDYFIAINYIAKAQKRGYILPIPMTLLPLYVPSECHRSNYLVPAAGQQPDLFNSPWGVITHDSIHVRYPYISTRAYYDIRAEVAEIIYSFELHRYPTLLSLFNIAYIIVFNNTLPSDPVWISKYPGYNAVINYLSSLHFLKPIVIGKCVSLYEVSDTIFKPRIYAASGLRIVRLNNSDSFIKTFSLINVSINTSNIAYIIDDRFNAIGISEADIKILESSPTYYRIYIRTNGSFFIVFSQIYDSQWILFLERVSNEKIIHTIVNGFANGWYVNTAKGEYYAVIFYDPQKYLVKGLIIWIFTLTSTLLLIIFYHIRKLNKYKLIASARRYG